MSPTTVYLLQSALFLSMGSWFTLLAKKKTLFSSLRNRDSAGRKVKLTALFTAFFISILVQKVPLYFSSQIKELDQGNHAFQESWAFILQQVGVLAFLIYYLFKENLGWIYYKKRKYLVVGVLSFAVAYPWIALAASLTKFAIGQGAIDANLPAASPRIFFYPSYLSPSFPLLWIVHLLITPTIVEILFRGLLQNFIAKLGRNPQKTAIFKKISLFLTPLVYALLSSGEGIPPIEWVAPLLVVSFYLSYLYQKTGSLLACILFHSLFIAIFIKKN